MKLFAIIALAALQHAAAQSSVAAVPSAAPSPVAPAEPSAIPPSSVVSSAVVVPPSAVPVPPTEPSAPVSVDPVPPSVSAGSTSVPSVSISGSITSINPSASSNVTMSGNLTSTALSPNSTANSTLFDDKNLPDFVPQGNDLVVQDIDMDLGSASLAADEQVLTLAYTANLNASNCNSLASQYAAGATPELKRHWADVEYRRRKRATFSKRCLATTYEIPVFVHWVLPPGQTEKSWVEPNRWKTQVVMAQDKLNSLGASLKIRGSWYWDSASAGTLSTNKWANQPTKIFAWVKNAKEKVFAPHGRNLHVFIVESLGESTINGKNYFTSGRANFPGIATYAKEADCVFIAKRSLPQVGEQDKVNGKSTLWATLPHEVGHWLGLIHLHDHGPDPKNKYGADGCTGPGDYVSGTSKYRNGQSYDETCLGTPRGPSGAGGNGANPEVNIMSYSAGQTYKAARFVPEQRVRATIGWLLRRDGMTARVNQDIRRVYTAKDCDVASKTLSARSWLPDSQVGPHKRELTTRQVAAELQRYCQRTDLVVESYDFDPISEAGINNENSPPLPNDPTRPIPETAEVGDNKPAADMPSGGNFETLKTQVQERVTSGQPIDAPYVTPAAVTVTAAPTSGGTGGTSGGSGAGKVWAGVGAAIGAAAVGAALVL